MCRQHKSHLLTNLANAVVAYRDDRPAPSLLSTTQSTMTPWYLTGNLRRPLVTTAATGLGLTVDAQSVASDYPSTEVGPLARLRRDRSAQWSRQAVH
jgi:hypothetical protein